MTRRSLLLCATAVLLLVALSSTRAASPVFWQVSTQADFLEGEVVENLAIDGNGRLVLGPSAALVLASSAPFIWDVEEDDAGNVLLGTGNDGQVIRVDREGKTSVLYDAAELEVHALARAADGALLAATSPDGRIVKIAKDGTETTFFDPEDKYLWALAVAADGTVYAGTGDKGLVYRITPGGQGAVFYRARAAHVTSLAFDRQGSLMVGTDSPGQVIRVDRQGKGFVLLDAPFREVRALRVDEEGNVYAAALGARAPSEAKAAPPPAGESPAPIPVVSTEVTVTAVGDVPVGGTIASLPAQTSDTKRDARGAVYRIAPDGLWDVLWQATEDSPFDIVLEGPDTLLVGTGGKGKIFRLEGRSPRPSLATRAAAQQVTAFARGRGGTIYVATSNPGKLYRISAGTATRGVYLSEVRDASTVATWGTIRWVGSLPAGASLEISTRSGNTGQPDETWSDWSNAYAQATGSPITSPKARYLQWRAVLSSKTGSPALTSVTVAYLPRNARPVVESITVHPPGTVFQRPFPTGDPELAGFESGTSDGRPAPQAPLTGVGASGAGQSPALGRRTFQKGLQTFMWKARDDNEDRLQYDVFYRRESATTWTALRRGLWDAILTWDTTTVPDGDYVVKVVASDLPSSSPDTALDGELESSTFTIDNAPPTIEFTGIRSDAGPRRATLVVRDGHSPVQRMEYSTDAFRWQVVHPIDGMADGREETFEVPIAGDASQVTVRATDALNNVATATFPTAAQAGPRR